MSLRRDIVTSTTTKTPEAGPVRWWLLLVGAPSANALSATGRGAAHRRVDFVTTEG